MMAIRLSQKLDQIHEQKVAFGLGEKKMAARNHGWATLRIFIRRRDMNARIQSSSKVRVYLWYSFDRQKNLLRCRIVS